MSGVVNVALLSDLAMKEATVYITDWDTNVVSGWTVSKSSPGTDTLWLDHGTTAWTFSSHMLQTGGTQPVPDVT